MELIQGKRNEDIYTISFWTSLAWMFLGPMLYIFAFIFLYANKYGLEDILSLINGQEVDPKFMSALVITELLAKILPMGLMIYVFKKILKNNLLSFKEKWLKYIFTIIIGIGLIIGLNKILAFIYDILNIEGTSSNQDYIETILSSNYRIIMFIIAVIIAPIFEELIFRKFLISYLKGKTRLSNFWIYTISAIVFAAVHIISNPADIIFFPLYFSLSLVITLAYKYSNDNLYVSTGIHFLNNLLSFLEI